VSGGPAEDGPSALEPSMAGVGLARGAHLAACAVLACVVLVTDQIVDPVTPILVVLITASAIGGFLRPDGIVAAGLIIGLSIPVLHLVSALVGFDLALSAEPGGVIGALSLVFLVVPALFAAVIGGYARRTLEEERRRPR